MWQCDPCGAEAEDHFEVCWRCGAPRAGIPTGDEATDEPSRGAHWAAETHAADEGSEPSPDPSVKTCVACGAELEYRGEIPLRTGGPDGWTLFHSLEQFGERLWPVHVWACSGCRRLALYEGEGD